MIQKYLLSTLNGLSSRLDWIKGNRPRDLQPEYDVVNQSLIHSVDSLVDEIDELLEMLVCCDSKAHSIIAQRYRELLAETNSIETIVLPAIANSGERDLTMTRIMRRISSEIKFPLQCPAVALSSQESFCLLVDFHLVLIPYREDQSPLQVPAFYHELGHLLQSDHKDSLLAPFQRRLLMLNAEVYSHFGQAARYDSRRKLSELKVRRNEAWQAFWVQHWFEEFICDAFAAATCGPAYGWAFIHGAISSNTNPYQLLGEDSFSTHPADAARLIVVLSTLSQLGWHEEVLRMNAFWKKAMNLFDKQESPDFQSCYPPELLDRLTEQILSGIAEIGCSLATPANVGPTANCLLNFWQEALNGYSSPSHWQSILADFANRQSEGNLMVEARR